MEVSISIPNLKIFEEAIRKSPYIVGKHLQNAITEAGYFFERETKQVIRNSTDMWKSPIDTGYMWNTIYTEISSLRAEIVPRANYSVFVHQGTRFMQARPFFEITAKHANKDLVQIFENNLDKAMSEIARHA